LSALNNTDIIEAPRRRAGGESSPQGISSVFNLLANPAASSGKCARVSVQENLAVSKILENGFLFILTPEFWLLTPE